MSGSVRTVTGDLVSDALGPTYVHEHLIIDSELVAQRWPEIHLSLVADAVTELHDCIAAGVRTMVDAMPAAAGRDPQRLAEASIRSGMRIIASTGLHTEKYYPDIEWAIEAGPEELAEMFVSDIEIGIDRHDYSGPEVDRTEHRAGIVKAASSEERPTARDRHVFEAAAITMARTGVPLLTHAEGGLGGMDQIEILSGLDVPLDRVAISHTDKLTDTSYHRGLLDAGVNLCFDQALRGPQDETNNTAILVMELAEAGFQHQLMLGTDGARRSLWRAHDGSPGLAWLKGGFVGVLERLGATTELVSGLFVENPARYLSLSAS